VGLVRYVARRLLLLVPTLLGVLLLVFVVSRVLIPNPARVWAGPRADETTVRMIGERYHLYDPVYIQFWYYLSDLLRGDWGHSPTSGQPVLTMIKTFFPATVELSIAAMVISIFIGVFLGVVSAANQNKPIDHASRIFALFGVASPPFLIALLMQLIFFYYIPLFPDSGGRISTALSPPKYITGLFLFDSLVTGNWPVFWDALNHLIMPAVALALLYFGIASRLTRASMLEAMRMDYVRMARAKGLPRRTVIYKHVLRNALIPTTSVMTVMFAYMLGGSVVTETIFSWPGVGRYAAQSILNLEYPAVMGVSLIFALSVVLVNLLADILYVLLDPRITLR
jgi:peptide/nickel transport system permease protein